MLFMQLARSTLDDPFDFFVGTPQGVAGLAPRPFTLGEETGSHHMVMYIAPACSSDAQLGLISHLAVALSV